MIDIVLRTTARSGGRTAGLWRHLDRHTSSSLFDSSHQHRVLAVVCAIERRQRLPAFRREPRDVGVSDVAKHFRGSDARCVGCRRYAKRYAKPLAMGALPARRRAEPRTGSLRLVSACRIARRIWCAVKGSPRPGRASGRRGRPLCLTSNLYQAWLSLPVCFEPSIHFTRPIVTMSEQWGRNGAACRVDTQSASNSSQVGAMLWKCAISPCITSRDVGRIGNDRIGRAVMVERKRILAGADVAGIDAAQAEGFQVPDQIAITGTGLGKGAGCRGEGTGSAAALPPVVSDRNQPRRLSKAGTLTHSTTSYRF